MSDGSDAPSQITEQLIAWSNGDRAAFDRLAETVESELRRLARSQLRREGSAQTLQTLDLVNEAYLRLVEQRNTTWQNRAHFFAISARIMRRVLLDHARKRQTQRRGGEAIVVALDEARDATPMTSFDLVESIDLHNALEALERMSPRQGRVVELRVFGGLTIRETAEVMELSPATIKRDWEVARAWLHRELSD